MSNTTVSVYEKQPAGLRRDESAIFLIALKWFGIVVVLDNSNLAMLRRG
jgi:hypothetical protein